MRTTSFSQPEYIPEALRVFAARRAAEVGGVALLAFVAAFALALATWSVSDPSLNHATRGSVHNLLGAPGAVAADLAMQLFGLGCLALLAPLGFWGLRLLSSRRLPRARLRLLLWLIGAAAAAGLASSLPVSDRWPLPTGLGGVLGDAVLALPRTFVGARGVAAFGIGLALAAIAILALTAACGDRLQDAERRHERDDADDEPAQARLPHRSAAPAEHEDDGNDEPGFGIVSLGAIVHAFLSFKASLARRWQARQARPARRRERPGLCRAAFRMTGRPLTCRCRLRRPLSGASRRLPGRPSIPPPMRRAPPAPPSRKPRCIAARRTPMWWRCPTASRRRPPPSALARG